jgi:integrase/recombinase XerD
MRYLTSTEDFIYAGRARPGFPLLVDGDMAPMQPAQDFLLWKLLGRGRHLSTLTWDSYGRRIWDYFRFLDANDLGWREVGSEPGVSPVCAYRDWSLGQLGLDRATVNARVRLIVEFYTWAAKRQLIDAEIAQWATQQPRQADGLLAHLQSRVAAKGSVLAVKEWTKQPEFLPIPQLKQCFDALETDAERILFALMTRVGLRACEARTFPVRYVSLAASPSGRMVAVRLQARHMHLKFDKERVVDVPSDLMADMGAYAAHHRRVLEAKGPGPQLALALNRDGVPFTRQALVESFQRLSKRVGFRVRPLMLRHSYAIHTLAALRRSPHFDGEPLLYVRDRLGHSSIQTTTIYLRQLDQIQGATALALDDALYCMFRAA